MKRIVQMLALGFLIAGGESVEAQIYGQRYLGPDGYESYQAGTMVVYGGYQYVIMPDGTMLVHPPICQDHVSSPNCNCGNACPCPHLYHRPMVHSSLDCHTESYVPVVYHISYARRRGCH